MGGAKTVQSNYVVYINLKSKVEPHESIQVKKFWELEAESVYEERKMLTEEEKRCEEYFAKTTIRDAEGRYVVKLPFRNKNPMCKEGNTRQIALRRLLVLEKRLSKNEKLKDEYR